MQLKQKLVALAILPLLLAIAVIGALVLSHAQRLGEQQEQLIETSIIASKKTELQNYVELGLSAVARLYASGRDDAVTQQQVLNILLGLDYGSDGYFFVYDGRGRSLMHPRQPELIGRDLVNMTNPHWVQAIQALLLSARSGDGFQRYQWEKPSTGQLTEKLAYVVMLERWDWMIGTGLYLDDVEQATAQARAKVAENIRRTMWSLAGVALVAVLLVSAGGLTLNFSEQRLADRKLKLLAQRIVSSQEDERSRVSRELHDGISQLLVSVKFRLELACHELESGRSQALETLRGGLVRLGGAIAEVRRISHDLRPSLLDSFGLPAAIGQLAVEFEQRSGLLVEYQQSLDMIRLPDGESVALFRIVQEALANIARHSQAGRVSIALEQDGSTLQLRVRDDGVGFDIARIEQARSSGIGLRNMRERVEHLGGRFTLSSTPGRTELMVSLPLPG
ncbi:cache domain-containing protein [Pseudomonas paeninsulae]|uniref:cache domain-containing protein n=1 Tax=Pseudomonas paeninsulae TaxID=3110772 RepID=UPI002D7706A1|nr:cache domain-containing protein [Pseudomonas sp. IT1137]